MERRGEQEAPISDDIARRLAGTRRGIVGRPGPRIAHRFVPIAFPSLSLAGRGHRSPPAFGGAGKPGLRASVWLAWAMWLLSLALAALAALLLIWNRSLSIHVYDYWLENTISVLLSSTAGALIVFRRPGNLTGWLFCAIGLLNGLRHFCAEYAAYAASAPGPLPGADALTWISSWTWVLNFGLYAFLGLLFPDGRLPTVRWRWTARLGAAAILLGTVAVAFSPGPIYGLDSVRNPFGISSTPSSVGPVEVLAVAFVLVAALSLFVRLHRARGVKRQQLRLVAYAAAAGGGGVFLGRVFSETTGLSWMSWVGQAVSILGIVGISAAMYVAILKYRLFDIDVLINRTLVYGALSASTVGIYVLIVGGLGALLQGSGNFAVSLIATGLVAVLFQPLHARLRWGVNHLMYGERDEPYRVLARLGQRLEAALAPDAALSTIADTVAQALKLPYAAIELRHDGAFRKISEHGSPKGAVISLPLVHHREEVGRMLVRPRAPGEEFSSRDVSLLRDLARQAGAAAHAARLTADLRRSREKLITAREEERRRLRRDLHDGLGPTLGALALGLDAARRTLPEGASEASEMLSELKAQTREAVSDIRRLAHGLRPPALDDLGLVPAIRRQAAKHGPAFLVEAEALPGLPAAVEVACYRIAQEAITNVSRHAGTGSCCIKIAADRSRDELVVEVADDGVGMSGDRCAGVGMNSMRERAEELGGTFATGRSPEGGTVVAARLPLFEREGRQER